MKIICNSFKKLKISFIFFSILLFLPVNILYADWAIEELGGGYNTSAGRTCSMAADSNDNLHMVYSIYNSNQTGFSLKYITNQQNTPDTWDSILVDAPSNSSLGSYNAICVGPNDQIYASYHGITGGDLKFAMSTGWPVWTTENVDTQDNVGRDTDIIVDSAGGIHISYFDATHESLKYAYRPSGGQWAPETVVDYTCTDTFCMLGRYASIALDSNENPHIIYYENNMGYLEHATKSSGTWTFETAASVWANEYTSMVANGDDLHISFYSFVGGNLMYATNAGGTWITETAHNSSSDLGKQSSIGLDSNGNVHISYYDNTEGDLEYVTNDSGVWVNQTIEDEGLTGSDSSLAITGEQVHIGYYKQSGNYLKYAHFNPDAPYVSSTVPWDLTEDVSLNSAILIAFSEAVDTATLTNTSISLEDDQATSITGVISYDSTGNIAVFTPDSSLTANTTYTVTVSKSITDANGTSMAKDVQFDFTTGNTTDTTAPSVENTYPLQNAVTTPCNTSIMILFYEEIDPTTLTSTSFQVIDTSTRAVVQVTGTIVYDAGNRIAVFTPDADFAESHTYQGTLSTDIRDLAGNYMTSDFVLEFTTTNSTDTTAPSVSSVSPAENAVGVATDSTITIVFPKPMNPLTIIPNRFSVSESRTRKIVYNWYNHSATLTFDHDLIPSKLYTVSVINGIKDIYGNTLNPNKQWTFTVTPGVISTDPYDGQNNVSTEMWAPVQVVFYGDMDPATITTSTFTITRNGAHASGTVTYDSSTRTADFQVLSSITFYSGSTYTGTITTGVQDINGVALEQDYTWEFTTHGDPPAGGTGGLNLCFISTLKSE